jgi:predicted phosphatase
MEKINAFDTIILDLDFTVWKGSKDHFWAKSLEFPIVKKYNKIYDKNFNYIELYYGVKKFLKYLSGYNKNIGFITRGGLLNIDYDQQPCIICLREFDILKYFNYKHHILYKTDNKSRVFESIGKTIFIDDNPLDLNDIKQNHPHVTVLDRTTFKNWNSLL